MRRTLNDFKPKLELTAKLLFVVWLKRCNTPFGEATDATASRRRGAFCTRPTAVRRPPKRPTKGGVGGREKAFVAREVLRRRSPFTHVTAHTRVLHNMRRTLNDFKPKLELTAKLLFVVWLKRCNTPFGEATDATASRRRGAFCTRPAPRLPTQRRLSPVR